MFCVMLKKILFSNHKHEHDKLRKTAKLHILNVIVNQWNSQTPDFLLLQRQEIQTCILPADKSIQELLKKN